MRASVHARMAIPNARKFVKGQSGNPLGNGRPTKLFEAALIRALKQEDPKTKSNALRRIADALVREAENGNVQAIKEIAERTDGKIPQPQQISGDPENPVQVGVQVSFVSGA